MDEHRKFMQRAIDLAARGSSEVSPNPMVGAVIVKDGVILSEGWHRKYGQPHAERNAIDAVTDRSVLEGSTMYVTLEPCCHYGKTPPCADYIIENGIKEVFIGVTDPNPVVSGGGIRKLTDAGITVHTGFMEKECAYACRFFLTRQRLHRPHILLKWAETSDGFIGTRNPAGRNIWFTGEDARIAVHSLRRDYDAIMVGTNTVLTDNPSLTVRAVSGRNPVRVTIDRKGILPVESRIFDHNAPTVVFSDRSYGEHVQSVPLGKTGDILDLVIETLSSMGLVSLMVEGGARLLDSFIEKSLYDEIDIFRVSRKACDVFGDIGGFVKAPSITDFASPKTRIFNFF